ncbi:hypothetical protein TSUD_141680 [Trifolium subterraneum]|uniref:RNase H type-1 domain-containing protein n=1 Tax=Trifolium subterraneum TaxID=3900 RepID=A0A2Z6P026_TRISU|nr:hypothetical protein TSUD_141680 [Trifolium subterraneum]
MSSVEGEAWTLLLAMEEARHSGLDRVQFESDSKVLIEAIHMKRRGNSEFLSIVYDILSIMSSFLNFEVKFVRRQASSVAHTLARAANSWSSFHRFEIIPLCMEENVGRIRQGRASRAHSSARKELAAIAPPPKRGRRGRQGPPVRGTHDVEESQAPQPQQQPEHEPQEANVEEEVYPGGPHDLSLLKDYHNHRAILIWDAQADDPILNKSLRCIASANKVIKFVRPEVAWFSDMVRATGLEPLVRSNFNVLDYGVLWSFAERWHPETSTFHLPIGEMGITLDDVQCLLHIPIEGKFLNHRKISRLDGAQMLSSFLGIDEADALSMFATLNGPHLKHNYVSGLVTHYITATKTAEAENRLMHDIRLYREKCDLSSAHEWNWGSAALVHLQNHLDYASQAGSS